ncbi:hypothetical protein C357_00914 [Citreicella sp. 357]|nr:hypothetical protein C357_00914 [Citreicella sp. 357]
MRLAAETSLDAHRDLVPAKAVVQLDQLTAENPQNVLGKVGNRSLSFPT